MNDIFNLTDVRRAPTGKDGLAVTTGFLVVGVKKTEAEFVAAYGGVQGPPPAIEFEDADGNAETGSPRETTP
jgi:hypothetical protein